MRDFISIVTPLLLHMVLSELTAMVLGTQLDAASCTMVSSVIVIPIAAWMYYRDCKAETRDACSARPVVFGIFCFIAGGIMNLAWSGILNLIHIQNYFSNQTQEALLGGEIPVQILGLGVLVPIAEELIFRALIYGRMKRLLPVKQAVVLSALLFAVYHGNLIQMIFAFPMALALAAIYERGKLFVFPVLFHSGANLTAIILNFCL